VYLLHNGQVIGVLDLYIKLSLILFLFKIPTPFVHLWHWKATLLRHPHAGLLRPFWIFSILTLQKLYLFWVLPIPILGLLPICLVFIIGHFSRILDKLQVSVLWKQRFPNFAITLLLLSVLEILLTREATLVWLLENRPDGLGIVVGLVLVSWFLPLVEFSLRLVSLVLWWWVWLFECYIWFKFIWYVHTFLSYCPIVHVLMLDIQWVNTGIRDTLLSRVIAIVISVLHRLNLKLGVFQQMLDKLLLGYLAPKSRWWRWELFKRGCFFCKH